MQAQAHDGNLLSLTAVCYSCLYSGPAAQVKCPQCGFLLIADGLASDRTSPNILALSARDGAGHLPGLHARMPKLPAPRALARGTTETQATEVHLALQEPAPVLIAERPPDLAWRSGGGTTAVSAGGFGFVQVTLVAFAAACVGVAAAAMSGMW